ncbi:AlkA N-terminal domain-containing protein [Actinomycetaceae bacterium MB13-C1-2]|nr:AlkA N-terminal domain-containing protein [Actinomycetaceae bacterium MB13-C1-2]
MLETSGSLYSAFAAKDARFDGRFFVAISSTGIYCRPVCRAKQPKKENCTFYSSAAEAEDAGFRPCLMCRPERAPGTSTTDASMNLARRTARMLEEDCGNEQSLEQIAESLGCSSRHLRRVFMAEYNVSPVQYLQTCRLLLAKSLLTDTDLSVIDVANASGFGSLRRFNEVFKKRYRLVPTALRKRASEGSTLDGVISVGLGYRPPYRWKEMLEFLARRAIPGVELVTDSKYMRTVRLLLAGGESLSGHLSVANDERNHLLIVTVSDSLLSVLPRVLARAKGLFDLHCDPSAVDGVLRQLNDVRHDAAKLGTRVPGSFDSFEMATRAILGQQISVGAARVLAGRIAALYGRPLQTGVEGLTHTFPSPHEIAAMGDEVTENLGKLGVISMRARAICELAQRMTSGDLSLTPLAQPEEEITKLKSIRGVGDWTAQYIAMRAMEWPDAFLATDVGIRKALPGFTSKQLLEMAERWRPWRSYATVSLWNALEADTAGVSSVPARSPQYDQGE